MLRFFPFIILILISTMSQAQNRKRLRDHGITPGVLQPGKHNAITDVAGVLVGNTTLIRGDSVRTGVTAILPHDKNLFQQKVPAAVYVGNGFGKLAGITQVNELGNLETPIVLTNTLGVGTAMNAVVKYMLALEGNENVLSVNALIGETNDGQLNDIRGMHVTERDVLHAITSASAGSVAEGNVGAGTGTVCFGFKGGIGTSSRKLPATLGGYTVGVLVQSNFGGVLNIDGIPAGKQLEKFSFSRHVLNSSDGSVMIVVATDAPVDHRNLMRLAKRAFMGVAVTGGIASNGSGDYVIAFSTAPDARVPSVADAPALQSTALLNDETSPLFLAAIEATAEAIWNSLIAADTMKGYKGRTIEALPIDQIKRK